MAIQKRRMFAIAFEDERLGLTNIEDMVVSVEFDIFRSVLRISFDVYHKAMDKVLPILKTLKRVELYPLSQFNPDKEDEPSGDWVTYKWQFENLELCGFEMDSYDVRLDERSELGMMYHLEWLFGSMEFVEVPMKERSELNM